MIRKEQQPEPQEGDSAMGATACSCEGGRASPPERQGGELKGQSQTHAVQGTRCRPGIRAEGLFRALTKGLIPRDLICLIQLPTPVFLPGKSHGSRSLVGYHPWGRKESDTTERLHFLFSLSTFMHWRRKWQPTPVFLPGDPRTGEPDGLPSMESHRVGHD